MMGGLVAVLTGHLVETLKIKAYAVALYVAAAASLLFAFVFGLVSLRHWIVVTYASQYPDLWIALGFVVLAAILVGVGVWLYQQKPKTQPLADIAFIAGPPAAKLVGRRLNARAVAVGVVLIAGLLVGRRMSRGA